jgi:signal transduction histidine kinase
VPQGHVPIRARIRQGVGAPAERAPRLSLLARQVLAIVLLALFVLAVATLVYVGRLGTLIWQDALSEATLTARQIYARCALTLTRKPSDDPLGELRTDPDLRHLVESSVGYSPNILYIAISDEANRAVLHSDARREGEVLPTRPDLRALVAVNPIERYELIFRQAEIYELALPMEINGKPLGTIRVGVALPLVLGRLKEEIQEVAALGGLVILAALSVAIGLSHLSLAPMRRLAEDMERLRRGEFDVGSDAGPRDEFGKLAFQLQLLGRQIRSDRAQLLTEQAKFQTAVNELEDGLMLFGADGRVRYANRSVEGLVGKSLADIEGAMADQVFGADHPLAEMLRRALDQGASFRAVAVELPTGPTGSAKFVASVFPVSGGTRPGEATTEGAIVLLKDLKSVAVSAQTLQSLIQYSAQIAALGQVTSEMAHDVRNPLNGMMVHIAVLRERLAAPPEDVLRSLDVLEREIGRLDSVVNKFMDLLGPKHVALKRIQINTLVQDLITLLEPEWHPKGITFAVDLAPDLPDVMGDEELLRRALMNILLNGCEAMTGGGRLAVDTRLEPEGVVKIAVTDTGGGIAPADLEQIFAMYYTTKPGGSGIGLHLVRRVVEMHNGDVEILSQVGAGTSVVVHLPAATTSG